MTAFGPHLGVSTWFIYESHLFFPLEIPCGINLFVSTSQMAVWDPEDDPEYFVLSFQRLSEQ